MRHPYPVIAVTRVTMHKGEPVNKIDTEIATDLLALAEEYLEFLWSEWHGTMSQADFDANATVCKVRAVIAKAKSDDKGIQRLCDLALLGLEYEETGRSLYCTDCGSCGEPGCCPPEMCKNRQTNNRERRT